jgi:hypothetical protein
MKRAMKLSAVSSALAIAAALAFSGQAMADTLDTILADISFPIPGRTLNMDLTAGVTTSSNTYAGLALGAETDPDWSFLPAPDGSFRAWCLEPQETLQAGNRTYDINTLEQSPVMGSGNPMGSLSSLAGKATRADDMRLLFGGGYNFANDTFSNVTQSLNAQETRTAFQIAVWEVANETAPQYQVGDVPATRGYFYVREIRDTTNDAAIIAQANSWLANLSSYTAAGGLLGLVRNDTGSAGQDFIVQAVPIPAAAWLFGSALIGAVGLGRRKQKKELAA